MFSKIISSINWVDLLVAGFVTRIIYIGIQQGFVVELFKFVGILVGIFVTFHYYTGLAKFLHAHVAVEESFLMIFCFGFLLSVVLVLFKLIREGTMLILKMEAHSFLNQWGGLAVAVLRSLLVGSLILISLQVSRIGYLQKNVQKSFLSPYLYDLSLNFYRDCYDGFVSTLFPNEKLNFAIFKLKMEKGSKDPK